MSVNRLGTNGIRPLVLLDLGDTEREALARVLSLAERHLDEIPDPNAVTHRHAAEKMIAELRSAAQLPAVRNGKGS